MSFVNNRNEQADETYTSIIASVATSAAMQVKGVASVTYDPGLGA